VSTVSAGAAADQITAQARQAGVVGAGGGGFPLYAKFAGRNDAPSVDTVIANGAECEPLLHKDAELMAHHAAQIVEGLQLAMTATGAGRGILGLKSKHTDAIAAFGPLLPGTGIELHELGDFYPTGDEYILVYETTGRLIPSAGLPLDVGCVVSNVESLFNLAAASRGTPVIRKMVTVAGAVARPFTGWVPLGVDLAWLIEQAGGTTSEDVAYYVGGVMMGKLQRDSSLPVTKTTAGVIVLPGDHHLVQRAETPETAKHRIGKSACDQCSYCTELCPRYLLGHDIEPHKVMRGLLFDLEGEDTWNHWGTLCCECGLCTLLACPEDLFPREACQQAKADLLPQGRGRLGPRETPKKMQAHPMYGSRHTPLKQLVQRLGLRPFDIPSPLRELDAPPSRLVLPLKQHAGAPATPQVIPGQTVRQGDLIADVAAIDLGAPLHAPVNGTIEAVDDQQIILATS
jgi:Na+-translocating ferredoxin:NAD+ oxidoreductase RnfC subunit